MQQVAFLVLMILVTVALIDLVSGRLRRYRRRSRGKTIGKTRAPREVLAARRACENPVESGP
jgi:thiosulfate reductase cytochrome b subunit